MQNIPVIYINLKKRTDRKINAEQQLNKIYTDKTLITRFEAIELNNSALGCSMSHLKCIETAKNKKLENVFICEDDINFLDSEQLILNVNTFLNTNLKWDVIIIGGNNMLPFIHINNISIQVMNCQTTTGYIVNRKYYDTLIENYKTGIKLLMKNPDEQNYRIDKYWINLQRKDRWYMIIPPTVTQIQDYSDIEHKVTNYSNYMLNYNKLVVSK